MALSEVMNSSTRVLVVAHRTAGTQKLLEEVRARAERGLCSFVLLMPRPYWDPESEEAARVIELALPLLEDAAGARVEASTHRANLLALRACCGRYAAITAGCRIGEQGAVAGRH
jgi:hypothetical protein